MAIATMTARYAATWHRCRPRWRPRRIARPTVATIRTPSARPRTPRPACSGPIVTKRARYARWAPKNARRPSANRPGDSRKRSPISDATSAAASSRLRVEALGSESRTVAMRAAITAGFATRSICRSAAADGDPVDDGNHAGDRKARGRDGGHLGRAMSVAVASEPGVAADSSGIPGMMPCVTSDATKMRPWGGDRAPAGWGLGDGQAIPWEYAAAPESREIVVLKERFGLFINGREVEASDKGVFQTVNPATEEKLADVSRATPADIDRAIRAARRAQRTQLGLAAGPRAGEVPLPDRADPPGAVTVSSRSSRRSIPESRSRRVATSTSRWRPRTSGTTPAGRTSSSTPFRAAMPGRSGSRPRSSRGTSRC